jgi:hypothetical protein
LSGETVFCMNQGACQTTALIAECGMRNAELTES